MTGLLAMAVWAAIPVLLVIGELRARKRGKP